MKLLNEDLNNSIHFEENKVNILVIENKKYFVTMYAFSCFIVGFMQYIYNEDTGV